MPAIFLCNIAFNIQTDLRVASKDQGCLASHFLLIGQDEQKSTIEIQSIFPFPDLRANCFKYWKTQNISTGKSLSSVTSNLDIFQLSSHNK